VTRSLGFSSSRCACLGSGVVVLRVILFTLTERRHDWMQLRL
jgi:hypothetical protein